MDTNLAKKISDLTKKIHAIPKESSNPYFNSKYFDINTMLDKLRDELSNNDLVLTQPIEGGKVMSIITDLESGESIESGLELPDLSDPQKIGSCITYFRRYTLQSLLALEAEDDDGNKASDKGGENKEGGNKQKGSEEQVNYWATQKQVDFIRDLIKNLDDDKKKKAEEALEKGVTIKQAKEWINKLQKK